MGVARKLRIQGRLGVAQPHIRRQSRMTWPNGCANASRRRVQEQGTGAGRSRVQEQGTGAGYRSKGTGAGYRSRGQEQGIGAGDRSREQKPAPDRCSCTCSCSCSCSCLLLLMFSQTEGQQIRQGLKPCEMASDEVMKPTRFFSEMRATQSQSLK